jgi:hypothetical protein
MGISVGIGVGPKGASEMVGAGVTLKVGINVSGGIFRASQDVMSGKQIMPWGQSAVMFQW